MNISVPEDLAREIKMQHGMNVSAVCREALWQEISRRNALNALLEEDGLERVEVTIDDVDSAFYGRTVWVSERDETTAYITRRGRIAVYDPDRQKLHQYDRFDQLQNEVDRLDNPNDELVAAVAQALGEKYVVELDI